MPMKTEKKININIKKENIMCKILIGKTIKEIKIAEDKKAILFIIADGEDVKVRVDGDCCSST